MGYIIFFIVGVVGFYVLTAAPAIIAILYMMYESEWHPRVVTAASVALSVLFAPAFAARLHLAFLSPFVFAAHFDQARQGIRTVNIVAAIVTGIAMFLLRMWQTRAARR